MEEIETRLNEKDLQGRFNWEGVLEKHKISVIIGLVGLILVGLGVLGAVKIGQPEEKIEIISSETSTSGTIFADIEGAIQKPGVYELSSGARVEDLLIAAGGLSAEADRELIEKSLNQAQKLTDGAKIYIPKKGEGLQSQKAQSGVLNTQKELVNINTASKTELEALWGIGPVTAQKIIDNRPYQNVEDLLTKKILGSNVYQRIAEQLTVY